MAEYLIQDTTLDAIADAINAKTGGSSAMTPAQMVTAIGSIPSGGGGQGIRDLVYDHTFSGGATVSGIVENNSFRLANASSSYYNIPLILNQPIALSNGDVIDITVSNPQFGGAHMSVGLFTIFGRVISAREWIGFVRNTAINQTATYHYEYTGNGTIVDSLVIMNDSASLSNASAELSLSINGTVLF